MSTMNCLESEMIFVLRELRQGNIVNAERFSTAARLMTTAELCDYLIDLASRHQRFADELSHQIDMYEADDSTYERADTNRWLMVLGTPLSGTDDRHRLHELERHEDALCRQYDTAAALTRRLPVDSIVRRQLTGVKRTVASLRSLRDAHAEGISRIA